MQHSPFTATQASILQKEITSQSSASIHFKISQLVSDSRCTAPKKFAPDKGEFGFTGRHIQFLIFMKLYESHLWSDVENIISESKHVQKKFKNLYEEASYFNEIFTLKDLAKKFMLTAIADINSFREKMKEPVKPILYFELTNELRRKDQKWTLKYPYQSPLFVDLIVKGEITIFRENERIQIEDRLIQAMCKDHGLEDVSFQLSDLGSDWLRNSQVAIAVNA